MWHENIVFQSIGQYCWEIRKIFSTFLIKYQTRPKDPIRLINEAAMQDSANYAIENFSAALQFRTIDREKFWDYCLSKSRDLYSESSEKAKVKKFLGEGS